MTLMLLDLPVDDGVARRFWAKTAKAGPNECWLWTGALNANGYSRMWMSGGPVMAHRVSFAIANGPIPHGLTIDHLCRVRRCVNPTHMEAVTQGENTSRRPIVPVTHCKRGHAFTEENTRMYRGGRYCRACQSFYPCRLRRAA